MLLLDSRELPTNRDELVKALSLGLAHVFQVPARQTVVNAAGDQYPALQKLHIDVSNATLRDDFAPAEFTKEKQSGVTVADFQLVGKPIRRGSAAITAELSLADARFEFRRDKLNRSCLVPTDGRNGKLLIRGSQTDIQAMLLPKLQAVAAEHGATIESAEWTLQGDSSKSLTFEARVKASKKIALFRASATILGKGRIAIDEHLNLKPTDLSCTGEGVLGNMLAGMVQGHLRQLEGKSIPLTAHSLGQLKLRNLTIRADKELIVEAELGN